MFIALLVKLLTLKRRRRIKMRLIANIPVLGIPKKGQDSELDVVTWFQKLNKSDNKKTDWLEFDLT